MVVASCSVEQCFVARREYARNCRGREAATGPKAVTGEIKSATRKQPVVA
jgi:hypothetical protein